jgi:hypothetical protein
MNKNLSLSTLLLLTAFTVFAARPLMAQVEYSAREVVKSTNKMEAKTAAKQTAVQHALDECTSATGRECKITKVKVSCKKEKFKSSGQMCPAVMFGWFGFYNPTIFECNVRRFFRPRTQECTATAKAIEI